MTQGADTLNIMDTHTLSERAAHRARFIEIIDSRGTAGLQAKERVLLVDAADAQLFGEDDAPEKHAAANSLLDTLAEAGRFREQVMADAKTELELIGAGVMAIA